MDGSVEMMKAFLDELGKIAAQNAMLPASPAKPQAISTGPRSPSSVKAGPQSTNYSIVHSKDSEAAYGVAAGSKSVPPPPVNT